jgi:hypothetical protein
MIRRNEKNVLNLTIDNNNYYVVYYNLDKGVTK